MDRLSELQKKYSHIMDGPSPGTYGSIGVSIDDDWQEFIDKDPQCQEFIKDNQLFIEDNTAWVYENGKVQKYLEGLGIQF